MLLKALQEGARDGHGLAYTTTSGQIVIIDDVGLAQ
jgi:hypothetical protein